MSAKVTSNVRHAYPTRASQTSLRVDRPLAGLILAPAGRTALRIDRDGGGDGDRTPQARGSSRRRDRRRRTGVRRAALARSGRCAGSAARIAARRRRISRLPSPTPRSKRGAARRLGPAVAARTAALLAIEIKRIEALARGRRALARADARTEHRGGGGTGRQPVGAATSVAFGTRRAQLLRAITRPSTHLSLPGGQGS